MTTGIITPSFPAHAAASAVSRYPHDNMKLPSLLLPFLAICLVLPCAADDKARSSSVQDHIDWPRFLAAQDLVWSRLPARWDESAFLGNGQWGAALHAEGGTALCWDVGRSDVVTLSARGETMERLSLGRFALMIGDGPSLLTGTMRLDLWNAEARGEIRTPEAAGVSWRSFTHSERPVTIVELTGTGKNPSVKWTFRPEPAVPARAALKKTSIPPDRQNPPPVTGRTGETNWHLQPFVAGGGYVVAWEERSAEPGWRLIAFTVDYVKSGAPVPDKAVADIRLALGAGIGELERTHREWWHAWWPRSFLSIPDERMQSFYWIQLYKLASATRADRPAIDLMGPWFYPTPWPRIWWNLNLQLTYWPVYAANRLDLGESFLRLIDEGTPNLIANVPPEWREDSAAIGRSSSWDCKSPVSGKDGEERGNLLWALHNYWLHYRFSGDETLLREKLYPLLKRAVGYYLHLLQPGKDGWLHVPLSVSPEYGKKARDTNYDLSLLRWGLTTLLATDERFALDDPQAPAWRETLEKLAPYPVDSKTGYMIGAGVPLASSHRHSSHLMMVHPLHLVDCESPADRPLIEKSFDHWTDLDSSFWGFSLTGASAMSSWLGRGDAAVRQLDEFLDWLVSPNTMYVEAGPEIEAPLAAAATLHELVLQSWSMETFGTHLRIFPAVPGYWKDVSFARLRAEGAFEVSAVRRNGKTRFVEITSLAGAPCRVRTGLEDPVVASGSREFRMTTERDHNGNPVTVIDLRKGETVLLTSAKVPVPPEELVIAPVGSGSRKPNFYGVPPLRRTRNR
ncbi:hypothetical protein OpiT1DRAFT_04169 [Opitutaceae bacterium TAV1]|nr:hypothetical protein OpiT1DRAFT_04169 [Opitutaceae bacterium TAV1]